MYLRCLFSNASVITLFNLVLLLIVTGHVCLFGKALTVSVPLDVTSAPSSRPYDVSGDATPAGGTWLAARPD